MSAEVLWPERESLYDLMCLRATIGVAAFNAEKQNDPEDPSLCEWPAEYFDSPGLWFDSWPDQLALRVVAVDPSKGKEKGDYSAVVRYARTAAGLEYVDAALARRPVDRICADVASACLAFNPDGLALEGNSFQELIGDPLRRALDACSLRVAVHLLDNTVPKQVRIRRLTGPLAQRRFRFRARSPGARLLVDQLRDFPNGAHDDGPDALEMARRLGIQLWAGRRTPGADQRARVV